MTYLKVIPVIYFYAASPVNTAETDLDLDLKWVIGSLQAKLFKEIGEETENQSDGKKFPFVSLNSAQVLQWRNHLRDTCSYELREELLDKEAVISCLWC